MDDATYPEYTAVILAATCGARLYPLTTSKNDLEMENQEEPQNEEVLSDKGNGGTASYMPKHLLPLAGRPLIHHLIQHCEAIGLEHAVVAVSSNDEGVTQNSLIDNLGCTEIHTSQNASDSQVASEQGRGGDDDGKPKTDEEDKDSNQISVLSLQYRGMKIILIKLPAECAGSADALRCIHIANLISDKSHAMVLPADLILYGQLNCGSDDDSGGKEEKKNGDFDKETCDGNALGSLADVHRRQYRDGIVKGMPLAMSMLLADVGEEDENGIPLKESAKAKKGGIAREDEEIEFIGLSTIAPSTQRVILKKSKYNVEEDEDNTGSTPKLHIPKARFHSPMNQIMIKTSWSELHVFCFAPWVLKLLCLKDHAHMKELGKEFVPYLVRAQFRGLLASFGVKVKKGNTTESGTNVDGADGKDAADGEKMETLIQVMKDLKLGGEISSGSRHFDDDVGYPMNVIGNTEHPFMVSAHVLSRPSSKLTLRACTIPSYVYACREVTNQAITASKAKTVASEAKGKKAAKNDIGILYLPQDSKVNTKFKSITLPETTLGEKVQVKSSTIGRGVHIGERCRLNNVVVHDNVTIGGNCVLQNSVLSANCIIGENCNLNDCQVRSKSHVAKGTRAKGEGF